MKLMGIFTLKVIIFNLVFFTFMYAYIPNNTIFLLKDLVIEGKQIFNKEVIHKQLIGSLSSCFAVKEKLGRDNIKNNPVLLEFGKKHLKELCK